MEAIDVVKTNYVKELLAKKAREDMRQFMDFRKIGIVTGLMHNAEGSAQVDLGNTRVLCGVKLIVEEPMKDTPNQGNMMVAAELLPLASADYETGPPSPEAIELARVVDRGIRAANSIDLKSLFIEEGKVWSVFIDLYVLNYDGNLFDACTLAAMAALMTTKVPKVEDGEANREDRTQPLKLDSIVTSTTFGKVGGSILLDLDRNEENASDGRITIAIDDANIRAMQKGLRGGFTKDEVEMLLDIAFQKRAELKRALDQAAR
ncbi:MAG: exosome complex protein Rrp42 [Candidatus Micrarchaeota archaeon]|nr:exosome complex protein Rrp42 [Candidatus Micrarchaeota archaeon]